MPNSFRSQLGYLGSFVRKKNFWIVLAVDIVLLLAAHYFAYLIRFSGGFHDSQYFLQFTMALPLVILVKLPVFYVCGLYRGMWRYTSLNDLLNITRAVFISYLVLVASILLINRFHNFSRSIFLLDAILSFLLICGHRVGIRYFYQKMSGSRPFLTNARGKDKKRLLLIGAGDAAEQIIREVGNSPTLPYVIVGLVDDNPRKIGLKIHNIPVLGLTRDLCEHCARNRVEEILIAISALSGEQMKRLNELCQGAQIEYKVLPGLGELIDGRVSIKAMRDISYKDLLGRAEVCLDESEIGEFLTGKIILVTGAGGSIGSELCRQIVRYRPARLLLLDAGEENLYNIQMELEHEYNFTHCRPFLGKIQNFKLLDSILGACRPTIIFHAAAYKHVPLVEINPWEAVFNNIKGSACLIEAAIVHRVERFVLVSTDKAVRPTNVMGASKRLTELLMLACTRENWDGTLQYAGKVTGAISHNTIFQAVRFGNVLGSSGSVIPLFKRQIEAGGPVTVTDPEITRYFMSIEEAARLILQAGAMGRGGEIFILKMGLPVKIDKMARDLIRLAGREPDTEIPIKYIGLRPGEKLYEELISEGEGIISTRHDKIMELKGQGPVYAELNQALTRLKKCAKDFDAAGIRGLLKEIIPEYQPAIIDDFQATDRQLVDKSEKL
ncbi:MAG TPA: polysaccharide biosynthesis protein [Proteobacteria bacterium]|nr:polysaccharide biosynthesis protein [Pseudomonadota bacterium]